MKSCMTIFMMLAVSLSNGLSFDVSNVGIIVAPNYGRFVIYEGDPGSLLSYNSKIGYQLGLYYKLTIAKKLDLRSEVSFSQRGTIIETNQTNYYGESLGTFSHPYRMNYLDITPQVIYSLSQRFKISAGPTIGLFLSGKIKSYDVLVSSETSGTSWEPVESSKVSFPEIGITTGIQVQLSKKLFTGLRYYHGLRSIMKDNEENAVLWKYRATNLQLVFGRSF